MGGMPECNNLRNENTELHARINKVEKDNCILNNRVRQLEDKLLEGNTIFQSVLDLIREPMETMKGKILTAISQTISGDTQEAKMDQAQKTL